MKTPESMQRLEELFHEAVSLEPRERADFMARLRDTDPELVAAVESLIAAHEGPDSMLDVPAYEAAAELIAEAQPALEAGQVVGHFWIIAPLGKGGMGEVYLAGDKQLDRKVALKLLPAGLTAIKTACAVLFRKRRPRPRLITRTSSQFMRSVKRKARTSSPPSSLMGTRSSMT